VFGAGVSALALACSFGEIDKSGTGITPPPKQDAADTAQPTDQGTPAAVANPGATAVKTGTGMANAPSAQPADTTDELWQTTSGEGDLGKEVEAILQVNCSRCHEGTKSGDMDYILELDKLVKNGKIIPGQKENSDLYIRMNAGNMPPAQQSEGQRPTAGQIAQVGQFIDELPSDFLGADGSCQTVPFISQDDQIAAMTADIQQLDSSFQPFTRYLTITYSSNAGGCEGQRKDLERQRFALYKGINSVSTNPRIGTPQPIDQAQTIFRIDIRDYNWDRGFDLQDDGVQDFTDGWEAIVGTSGPYAIPFTGDQADILNGLAKSPSNVAFLPVNAFIQATEFGDLYYTLIGGKANLHDFEKDVLLLDTAQEINDDNVVRAGFSNSGVSKQERGVSRFDQGTAGGYAYWLSFDFDGCSGNGKENLANESLYQDPLNFKFTGGEAIFNLPNGMQGYYVANAAGGRLAQAPVGIVIDPAQNNGIVTNGASCHSCHNAGMIPFTDGVRTFVENNKTLFDNDTFEHVERQFPGQTVFQQYIDSDSLLHVNSVAKAGVPAGTPDPVGRVYLDFQFAVNITAKVAAGELQVSEQDLSNEISRLDPLLSNLAKPDGYVDRNVFTDVFLATFCELHSTDTNQPSNCP
jgi:serine/threonine-protein kinase